MIEDKKVDEKELIGNNIQSLDEKIAGEVQSRPERLLILNTMVEELFPGPELAEIRKDIMERSMNVPQYGEYHNEGILMDTHLAHILETLDNAEKGEFPANIPAEFRQKMQEIVSKNKRSLQMYTFLHDISKADCLNIKYKDGSRKEFTWEEWQNAMPEGSKNNPKEIKTYMDSQNIDSVSYYHKEAKHGEAGAEKLKPMQARLAVPPQLLMAINKHEVAYQFTKVSIKSYEKHLGSLTDEERDWAMTASYIDTASSLGKDNKPDLSNFINLANTIQNIRIIKAVEDKLRPQGKVLAQLDTKKVEATLADLKKMESKITDTVESLTAKLEKDCLPTVYDRNILESNLEALVTTGKLSPEMKIAIFAAVNDNGLLDEAKIKPIREVLKQTSKLVASAFESSKKFKQNISR